MNVTIEDIKDIENTLGKELSTEQRVNVLNEYNRVCMDKGEDWETLITELIQRYAKDKE